MKLRIGECATQGAWISYNMTFNSLLIVAVIAVAVPAVFVLANARRRPGNRNQSAELEKLRGSGHYWGVKIQPGSCSAIRPFAGRRFGFDEAPALPLPGCTARRCSCTYVGVTERRRDERRGQVERRSVVRIDDEHADRRSLHGRRRYKERIDPAD
jgi:hypothetical protein